MCEPLLLLLLMLHTACKASTSLKSPYTLGISLTTHITESQMYTHTTSLKTSKDPHQQLVGLGPYMPTAVTGRGLQQMYVDKTQAGLKQYAYALSYEAATKL
jgi:hypothetical protein